LKLDNQNCNTHLKHSNQFVIGWQMNWQEDPMR
jgi:hypothetical protein